MWCSPVGGVARNGPREIHIANSGHGTDGCSSWLLVTSGVPNAASSLALLGLEFLMTEGVLSAISHFNLLSSLVLFTLSCMLLIWGTHTTTNSSTLWELVLLTVAESVLSLTPCTPDSSSHRVGILDKRSRSLGNFKLRLVFLTLIHAVLFRS